VRLAQREAFRDEYLALSSGKPIPSKSQLTKLCPGWKRLYSLLRPITFRRISAVWHTTPVDSTERPLGYQAHRKALTWVNEPFCRSQVSQRYWVIAAREEIRKWESECNTCKRWKSKAAGLIMAPLPKARLGFSLRPFAKTAVDYAGPLITVQVRGLRRQKRWLCLFTCLTTGAVHLEGPWGLDTDSFLNHSLVSLVDEGSQRRCSATVEPILLVPLFGGVACVALESSF